MDLRWEPNYRVIRLTYPWSAVVEKPNKQDDIFAEFLAIDEELKEAAQDLGDVVAHLLPPPPDQIPPEQDQARASPPTPNL